MSKLDNYYGIFFFILGLVLYIIMPQQVPVKTVGTVGPGAFPQTIAVIMMVCGLCLAVESFYKSKKGKYSEEENTVKIDWAKELRVIFAVVIMIAYVLMMTKIGFLAASLICGVVLMAYLKVRTWWLYPVYGVVVLFIYYVFKYLLYIQLP